MAISQFLQSFGARGHQPHWFSKLVVWGAGLLDTNLKGRGSNPSLLREKLWVLSSLMVVSCCGGIRVYGKIMFQTILPATMYTFTFSPDAQTCLDCF